MKLRTKIAWVMGSVIMIATVIFGLAIYKTQKKALLDGIDSQLLATAHLAREILPVDYHDNIDDSQSVSKSEYSQIVDRWNRLCEKLGLEYIWSLMKIDEQIVFTSGASTSKDITQGDYAPFFEPHSNPELYETVFATMEPQYQINDDKWGRIRAVLVPFRDAHGRPYLFGASMKMTEVDAQTRKTLWKSLTISAVILGLGMFLTILLAGSLVRPLEKLTRVSKEIASGQYDQKAPLGGGEEIESLSQSISAMGSSISRDITERKRVEEALRESENKFKSLFDQAGDYIIVLEPQLDGPPMIVDANQAAIDKHGFTRDEFIGKTVSDLDDEINKQQVAQRVKRIMSGEHLIFETVHTRKDGSTFPVEVSVKKLESAGKKPLLVSVERDITKRKQTQEALQESENIFKLFMELSPIYVFFKDTDLRSIRLSKNFEKMLGKPLDQLVNKTLPELFPPDLAESIAADDRRILKDGKQITVEEEFNEHFYETTKFPIYIDEKAKYLAGFTIDITERKLAEAERKKLEAQLRQAQKMEAIGQLAGGVAHDFNNLLQAILGYGAMALEETDTESEAHESIEQMLKAGRRAETLISQMLAFSRRQVLEMRDVDLNDLVANLMKMVHRVIGEHIMLNFISGHALGIVRADPSQIEHVLINLCVNARDAMPDGGRITIETKNVQIDAVYCESNTWAKPGQYACLSVTDTGFGMDEETLSKIFEPFFTTKEVGKGTGLGLSMIYGLVKQHQGLLHVHSEVGKGAAFEIYLPLTEQIATTVVDKKAPPVRNGTETILFAEDDATVFALTKIILERAGYTILSACDGEEALRVFEENADHIDLALLDVMMPKLSGRAVYERIRQTRPDIKFLFASGYNMDAIHTNFVLDKDLALIQKPCQRDDLLRKVREILDSYK